MTVKVDIASPVYHICTWMVYIYSMHELMPGKVYNTFSSLRSISNVLKLQHALLSRLVIQTYTRDSMLMYKIKLTISSRVDIPPFTIIKGKSHTIM